MKIVSAGIAALCMASAANAQSVSVNPGQWEYTTDIMMESAMGSMPQSDSDSSCLKPEDATQTPADFAESGCEVTKSSMDGETLKFSLSCDQMGVPMEGKMAITPMDNGNALDISGEMSGEVPQMGEMKVTIKASGKRVGAC